MQSAKWISLKAGSIESHNQWVLNHITSETVQDLHCSCQLWHAYLSILYCPHSVHQQNLSRLENTFGLASKAFADRNTIEMNLTKRQPSKWHLHLGRTEPHPISWPPFIYTSKTLQAAQIGPVPLLLLTHSRLAEKGKKIRETTIVTGRCHPFCRSE